MNEAKELKKNYEWLQAAENYKKAYLMSLKAKDLRAADLQEKIGFCFYKAALQAKSNIEFKKILKQSILAYERESELLKGNENEIYKTKTKHANALVAYVMSRYETDPNKIKRLLRKWWRLENQVLRMYEASGDLPSVGKTCNDLIEYSSYTMLTILSNYSETKKIFKDSINLSEKAIKIFSKLSNNYELARAYCSASWHYSFGSWHLEDNSKIFEFSKKCQEYVDRALEFAHKVGDAWLIGRAYHSAWNAAYLGQTNPSSAMKYGDRVLEYGVITKDNYLLGNGNSLKCWTNTHLARLIEDPEKQKKTYENTIELSQKAQHSFRIIQHNAGFNLTYAHYIQAISDSALIETDSIRKQNLLQKATRLLEEGIGLYQGWKVHSGLLFFELGQNYYRNSELKGKNEEKRKALNQSEIYIKKALSFIEEMIPFNYPFHSSVNFFLVLIQIAYTQIEADTSKKMTFLQNAIIALEKCISLVEKRRKILQSKWAYGVYFGLYYFKLGLILQQVYNLSKEEESLVKGINSYERAVQYYTKAETPTYLAESHWHLAQLLNHLEDFSESSKNYELASKAYLVSARKIPQIKQFYESYSTYMIAWSQIEQAKHNHSIEDYNKAKQNYEEAANLHESTDSWSYLSPNYSAWAYMEKAEDLSRKEITQQAKETFQKALEQFNIAQKSIKQKIGENTSAEEKELNQKLLQAADLRRKFCQARIQIEDAKLLDRRGKYLQSSKSYREAAQNILSIVEKVDVETERREMEYLAILCQAWEKMAFAEETTSSEPYLDAAMLFEKAKEHCFTKKASLWALGNSSFCKGLAAGIKYQSSADLTEHSKAKSLLKNAANSYLQAGFKLASEYSKATQRLFDAYAFMNQAENELDQEKRAKHYQMAENLLQIAASSFMKAKQPEKTAKVKLMLENVKEEKAMAVSLNEVMRAPTIASTTSSFTAPTPTREASVGLEKFEHANVQANLITGHKEVKVGESFCLSVEFVNAGKEPALLTRVENFVLPDFTVVEKPEIYRLEEACLNMKGKQIAPLKLVEAKLVLQPSKKGIYQFKPTVHYLDELGQNKSLQLKSVEIRVEEVILSDRVSTGTKELDSLLLGGIPKEYAVVLTGPPSDERELIVKNFLEAGTKEDQTSFYVATEVAGYEYLLKKVSFYLFLCNPKPKVKVPDLPNVTRLRSKTDLTNLNIALLKAYRNVDPSLQKRVCLGIVSDVLVDHGAKTTRKWIAELTTDLVSKGFTVLAVINPEMHTPEQTGAVLDLFDGEISITQTEDPLECKKSLRIKKLRNQDYIKNPICLTNF